MTHSWERLADLGKHNDLIAESQQIKLQTLKHKHNRINVFCSIKSRAIVCYVGRTIMAIRLRPSVCPVLYQENWTNRRNSFIITYNLVFVLNNRWYKIRPQPTSRLHCAIFGQAAVSQKWYSYKLQGSAIPKSHALYQTMWSPMTLDNLSRSLQLFKAVDAQNLQI